MLSEDENKFCPKRKATDNYKFIYTYIFSGNVPLSRVYETQMAKFSNKFSMKSKYGALAVTATPIVILAGIYVGMAYASRYAGKRKHKANALGRSVSMGALHGGKLAVRRLIDYQTYRASETSSTDAEKELKALLEMETPDVKSLQVQSIIFNKPPYMNTYIYIPTYIT